MRPTLELVRDLSDFEAATGEFGWFRALRAYDVEKSLGEFGARLVGRSPGPTGREVKDSAASFGRAWSVAITVPDMRVATEVQAGVMSGVIPIRRYGTLRKLRIYDVEVLA